MPRHANKTATEMSALPMQRAKKDASLRGKNKKAEETHWKAIVKETGFEMTWLKDLEAYYLHAQAKREVANEERRIIFGENSTKSDSIKDMSFHDYCSALHTLQQHGEFPDLLEFLFYKYAVESEAGISRQELANLMQDHLTVETKGSSLPLSAAVANAADAVDPRAMEKLYTWTKKYFKLHDRDADGYLTYVQLYDMLRNNAMIVQLLRLHVDKVAERMKKNVARQETIEKTLVLM